MKFTLIILFFTLCTNLFGQRRTYAGIETAVTNDVIEIRESGSEITSRPLIGGRFGFLISQEISDYGRVEIGFTYKDYQEGFAFKTFSGTVSSEAVAALCIPLRIHPKIPIVRERLYISPVVGVAYAWIPGGSLEGESKVKVNSGTDSISFISYGNYGVTRSFFLFQTGLSLDFIFRDDASLTLFSTRYGGHNVIYHNNFSYQKNNSPLVYGETFSKGTFWDIIGISYIYPISKIWQKKSVTQRVGEP